MTGVGDGGTGENKARLAAIKRANPLQSAQHVGNLAAKDAAIGVHFIDHDIAQPAEKVSPLHVIGQDASVQHVGVAEDDAGAFANARPVAGWGVTIVGGDEEIGRVGAF